MATGTTIEKLWAKGRIDEFEVQMKAGQNVKQQLTELAVELQVPCS